MTGRSIHVPQNSPQTSLRVRPKSEDGHCTKKSLIGHQLRNVCEWKINLYWIPIICLPPNTALMSNKYQNHVSRSRHTYWKIWWTDRLTNIATTSHITSAAKNVVVCGGSHAAVNDITAHETTLFRGILEKSGIYWANVTAKLFLTSPPHHQCNQSWESQQ